MVKVTPLELKEVLVLMYDSNKDNRGTSHKLFSRRELTDVGIVTEFVEITSHCPKKAGTLYGIHFQNRPKCQTKLLCCTKGRGVDFAVDLRKESPTFRQWVCMELTANSRRQIYIPAGFGHAFLSLEDDTEVVMAIDRYFDPTLARSIAYNDPQLNISFPITNPILADHDRNAPLLEDSDINL